MAFIKNKNAANSPISTDLRNIFIGRAKELVFFAREILQPEDPAYNIISIWGNAGVGKSTLLTKFIDIASSPDFKDYCLTAQADERRATPTSIMEKFAEQLRIAGYPLVDFEKALDTYMDSLRNLRTRQDMQRAIFPQSNKFEPASIISRDNLNFRENSREKINAIAQNFEIGYLVQPH